MSATISRRSASSDAPMSFAQELVWLLDRATPGMIAYNVPRALRLTGALDVDALRAALERVVARHEILRTSYASGEHGPVQVVHPAARVELPIVDRTATPESERAAEAERLFLEQARTPFDLGAAPPLRAFLVRFAADDHVLVLVSHHIASDGWSKGVLYRELSAAYAGQALPELPVQYGDFAAWQRDAVQGGSLAEHLAYWRERLAPPLPSPEMPTEMPRPTTPSFDGSREATVLPSSLVARVRELGMDHGATLYMVLLATYHTVLHRYSGQEEIITGSPTASRNHPEIEGLVGYFANTLPMRSTFAGDPTFAALLEQVAEHAVEAYEHEDVPFEKLVLELRDLDALQGNAPLFGCVLTMEDTIPDALELGRVQARSLAVDFGMAKFDLTLLVAEQPEGLRLALWYRTDLYSPAFARRFLGHFTSVLEAAVEDAERRVSALPMVTAEERAALAAWNHTTTDVGAREATLASLFAAQATRVPERAAVVAGDVTLTYAELDARANRLARHLQSLGVAANTPVGLLLDRSADAIVGLLGIVKAGGAYVPLSVDAPAARLAGQLAECGARAAVTSAALAERLPASVQGIALDRDGDLTGVADAATPLPNVSPDDLAYVLYTSGSTGTPKGVAVTHANAVHYARAVARVLAPDLASVDGWHFGLASTLAADLGNTSLLPSLLGGGTLHVLGKDVTTEPARWADYTSAHRLDVLKATPNHVLALVAGKTGRELAPVLPTRWLVTGGEALRPDVARTFLGAGTCRVLNHYGPTETTVGALTFEVTTESLAAAESSGAQTVPLGRPLANTHAYVVDAFGNEQPVGIPGELLLGGAGVARGYLKRDDLTAERFTQFADERVYRTGDRARRLADGTIEFLGRADDQVKVRGYRVELGEVEGVLRRHPGVAQAAVVLRGEELAAYAVPKAAGYAVSHADRPTADTLRAWLAAQLPEYMVPGAVVLLDALPLTPNGKLDRAALPAPEGDAEAVDRHVAPRTPTEQTIARIWQDVLKKERVGVTDSFLDLGGHSLLAIRVLGRISKELGVRLALRALFETPTVAQLAELVDAERAEAALRDALAAIEGLSDADVARQLAGDGSTETR